MPVQQHICLCYYKPGVPDCAACNAFLKVGIMSATLKFKVDFVISLESNHKKGVLSKQKQHEIY